MNHIHRSVWSPSLGTCVATSEHVRGRTQSSSSGRCRGLGVRGVLHALSLAVALLWGFSVQAAPEGGVVSAGQASIGGSASAMVIVQGSEQVSLNWKSFGLAAGESVQFVQPSRSSVALNRVWGGDASVILGRLSANGQVFLINPNGILFGSGASVSVGGLVASTLNLSDADAQASRHGFSGGGTGAVVNQGDIRAATGGYVALLAHRVSNTGTIVAPLGAVALGAGEAVTLDISGDQLINVSVARGVADAWVSNSGQLQADGGWVTMSTQALTDVLSNAVNNSGLVQAHTVGEHHGEIVLLAGTDLGTLAVSGTLDAGNAAGVGGQVVLSGREVVLQDAHIQASGLTGGGVVLIGGGYQGQNANVPHAQTVFMNANSRIEADALGQGDGGLVVLWSGGQTHAHGYVSARGGAAGGDGGLVETSGQRLQVGGVEVDTRAPLGRTGNWLLDPADITISSAVTTDATNDSGTYAPNSTLSAANINVSELALALGLSNVTVTTTNTGDSGAGLGDIDVDAALTWTATTTLTLNALRDVNVNQAVTGTNGTLLVNAGRDVNVNAAVGTTTGSLAFTALQDVTLGAATTVTTGDVRAVAGRSVNVTAASTVTTGDIVLRADHDGSGPGALEGTVSIGCGTGCLTITEGELNIRFNPVDYASTESEILVFANSLTGGTLNAKAWVFGQGDNKPYDGNTSATVDGLALDTAGGSAPVTWNGASNAEFDNPNAGPDRTITYESTFSDPEYALFAADGLAANTHQTQADITARPLTITATDVSKALGESPTLTEFTTTELVGVETVDSVTLVSDGQPAGASAEGSPYAITASAATGDGFTPSNYDIAYVDGVLTVQGTPVDPTDPVDPVDPLDPLDPLEPVDPIDPVDPAPRVREFEDGVPWVVSADAVPSSLGIAPQAPVPQGPLSMPLSPVPASPRLARPLATPVPALQPTKPRPVVVAPVLPMPRAPKQDRN